MERNNSTKAPGFDDTDIALPATVSRNEKTVRDGFWPKMQKVMAKIPFAENAIAAWYCAFDPATPLRAKAILLAALAYFIMPIDVVPDMLVGLGFTDDMAVLATAIGLIRSHLKDKHFEAARKKLDQLKQSK